MGLKIKEKRLMPLEHLFRFYIVLNKLQQPTRGDEKRLDDVEQVLQNIQKKHDEVCQAFFKENNISTREDIDEAHPLFNAFNQFYLAKAMEPKFPVFTEEQFAAVTTGVALSRGEKKLLKYWLLKP